MNLVFSADHAGFALRTALAVHARNAGHSVIELGAQSEEPFDYPDAADEAVGHILDGSVQFGVFVCGSGTGICIRANRHKGIRGAVCTSVELAMLAREHNDANVLCLGARTTPIELAKRIVDTFITGTASEVERHQRRVAKLDGNV